MIPELIEPLAKSVCLIVGLSVIKIVFGRAAHRCHGGGRLGYSLDTVLQVLPTFPLLVTAFTATQVTFDGKPDWPLWAVWSATLLGGVVTALLSSLSPVRDAAARLNAAQKAVETVDRIQL